MRRRDASRRERAGPASPLLATLRETGETVAVAESCTGGWLSKVITDVPGASECFWGGVVAYDDRAKQTLLGVDGGLLRRCGAVSAETAVAMARGMRCVADADWTVAVTGIAGPEGGSPDRPVGTVWVAIDGPVPAVEPLRLSGDRDRVRKKAVEESVNLLCRQIRRAHA